MAYEEVVTLTRKQHVGIINEYWDENHGGVPRPLGSDDVIYDWIENKYNCVLFARTQPGVFNMTLCFKQLKDLTFFLLNHP